MAEMNPASSRIKAKEFPAFRRSGVRPFFQKNRPSRANGREMKRFRKYVHIHEVERNTTPQRMANKLKRR